MTTGELTDMPQNLIAEIAMIDIGPMELLDKLAALGSAGQIRDFFVKEAIRGDHNATSCPVAVYLRREAGVTYSVGTQALYAEVGLCRHHRCPDIGAHTHAKHLGKLPAPVREFIWKYDRQAYPELDVRNGG